MRRNLWTGAEKKEGADHKFGERAKTFYFANRGGNMDDPSILPSHREQEEGFSTIEVFDDPLLNAYFDSEDAVLEKQNGRDRASKFPASEKRAQDSGPAPHAQRPHLPKRTPRANSAPRTCGARAQRTLLSNLVEGPNRNVFGLITSFYGPSATKGSDYLMKVYIADESSEGRSVLVQIFHPSESFFPALRDTQRTAIRFSHLNVKSSRTLEPPGSTLTGFFPREAAFLLFDIDAPVPHVPILQKGAGERPQAAEQDMRELAKLQSLCARKECGIVPLDRVEEARAFDCHGIITGEGRPCGRDLLSFTLEDYTGWSLHVSLWDREGLDSAVFSKGTYILIQRVKARVKGPGVMDAVIRARDPFEYTILEAAHPMNNVLRLRSPALFEHIRGLVSQGSKGLAQEEKAPAGSCTPRSPDKVQAARADLKAYLAKFPSPGITEIKGNFQLPKHALRLEAARYFKCAECSRVGVDRDLLEAACTRARDGHLPDIRDTMVEGAVFSNVAVFTHHLQSDLAREDTTYIVSEERPPLSMHHLVHFNRATPPAHGERAPARDLQM